MGHGEGVNATEANAIADGGENSEHDKNRHSEKWVVRDPRQDEDEAADSDEDDLRSKGDGHGDAGLFFLTEDAEFEAARKTDGQDIAEGEITERAVEQCDESGYDDDGGRRGKHPTDHR